MRLGGTLSFTTLVMVLSNGIIGTMLSCCAWTEVSASIEKSMDMKNDFFIEKNVFGVCVVKTNLPAKPPILGDFARQVSIIFCFS